MKYVNWLQKYRAAAVLATAVSVLLIIGWQTRIHAYKTDTLRVGSRTLLLQVADTSQKQAQGLGGRVSMPANQGMLFVFTKRAVQCFWMRDMRFSLDMIWVDTNRQVVHVEQNVSPDTYPQTFCPDTPAQYVIEVNAGAAARTGIYQGQILSF